MSKKIGLAVIVLALAGGMVLTGCSDLVDPALLGRTWSYTLKPVVSGADDNPAAGPYTLKFSNGGTLTFGGRFVTGTEWKNTAVVEEGDGTDIPSSAVVAYTAKNGTLIITGNGFFGVKDTNYTYSYNFVSGKLVITNFFSSFLDKGDQKEIISGNNVPSPGFTSK
ncbi:MAG: hypothetical protein LBT16_11155 [Treponema sp.]|jgi:hypothetical protein|nr:hypothetical protein [Treponema sp.]